MRDRENAKCKRQNGRMTKVMFHVSHLKHQASSIDHHPLQSDTDLWEIMYNHGTRRTCDRVGVGCGCQFSYRTNVRRLPH